MPYKFFYFRKIRSCDTLSKAFAKSKYIISDLDTVLRVRARLSIKGIICVVHDLLLTKPCCLGSIKCPHLNNSSLGMHGSKTFITRHVSEIGR